MMKHYIFKLVIRVTIFLAVFFGYLFQRDMMWEFFHRPIRLGITPLHALWAIFMVMMLNHIVPFTKVISMAWLKAEKKLYVPSEHYKNEELYTYVQEQNVRAWIVMLIWLFFNGIFGLLYVLDLISEVDLLMLTVFCCRSTSATVSASSSPLRMPV